MRIRRSWPSAMSVYILNIDRRTKLGASIGLEGSWIGRCLYGKRSGRLEHLWDCYMDGLGGAGHFVFSSSD